MTEYVPRLLHYEPDTQRIVNKLPYHHKVRREKDSIGQELVNAILGVDAHYSRNELTNTLNDKFLTTASLDQPDIIWTADLNSGETYSIPTKPKNLLRNSSFEIWTNQLRIPDWWYSEIYNHSNYAEVIEDGAIGNRSIEVEGAIWQNVPEDDAPDIYTADMDPWLETDDDPFKAGQTYTISWYHKVISAQPDATARLSIAISDDTGGSSTTNVDITPTVSDNWQRSEYSFTLSNDTTRIDVGFEIYHARVRFDAVQLELAEKASSWAPHICERPFHFDKLNLQGYSPVVIEHPYRVQYTAELSDFWKSVPERIQLESSQALSSPLDSGTAGYAYEIDFWGDRWTTKWTIDSYEGTDYIYKMGADVDDMYGRYLLAVPEYNGILCTDTDIGYDWTFDLYALTYFRERLWVICKGTHKQKTKEPSSSFGDFMCLAVVNPDTPYPEPDYLEVDVLMRLPGFSTSWAPVRVEFIANDSQHIYVSTDDTRYCYRLFYDYFMLSGDQSRIHLRENYSTVNLLSMAHNQKDIKYTLRRP